MHDTYFIGIFTDDVSLAHIVLAYYSDELLHLLGFIISADI